MSPCPHVSIPPCLHVFIFLHVSMSHVYVSVFPCLYVSMSLSPSSCLHVSRIPQMENRINIKQQLLFVCCKWITETVSFHLFAANINGKRKFVFLGRLTINGNWHCCFSKCAHLWAHPILQGETLTNYFDTSYHSSTAQYSTRTILTKTLPGIGGHSVWLLWWMISDWAWYWNSGIGLKSVESDICQMSE
jgi:hypothetical protein